MSDAEMSFDPKEIWITPLIDVEDANTDLTVGLSALRRYAVSKTNVICTCGVTETTNRRIREQDLRENREDRSFSHPQTKHTGCRKVAENSDFASLLCN